MSLLAQIDAFLPAPGDNWAALDGYVEALVANHQLDLEAVPVLLRVFERFPRHDGHGVLWSILHAIETVAGYEPIVIEHVMRTPTEMGVTMLQRIVNAGITHVGVHEIAPLIVMLSARAPIVDYTIEPVRDPGTASTSPRDGRSSPALRAPLLDRLAAFDPPASWDTDWSPLRTIVDELLATGDLAIVTPLLATLDRFHSRDGFAVFWPIVNGLEAMPGWPGALVASMQQAPTRNGLTLVLRLLARGVTHVDGVDLATFAAARMR